MTGRGYMNTQECIINKLNSEGINVFTVNDLIGIADYDTLRKNLERMTKDNIIKRIIRGVYYLPKYNKTFNTYSIYNIDDVAKAIARWSNWVICPSGNYALNILGLSTQIPNKYTYISSGPYRKYDIEGSLIEFKNVSQKQINNYSYMTLLVVQAIKEIGKDNISDNDLLTIKKKLKEDEIKNLYIESKQTVIWIFNVIERIKKL